MTSALLTAFSSLSPAGKMKLLTRLVHAETLRVRDRAAPAELQASNDAVHAIAGYMAAILDERTSAEQDAAILQTLAGAPHLLAQVEALMAEKAAG